MCRVILFIEPPLYKGLGQKKSISCKGNAFVCYYVSIISMIYPISVSGISILKVSSINPVEFLTNSYSLDLFSINFFYIFITYWLSLKYSFYHVAAMKDISTFTRLYSFLLW